MQEGNGCRVIPGCIGLSAGMIFCIPLMPGLILMAATYDEPVPFIFRNALSLLYW